MVYIQGSKKKHKNINIMRKTCFSSILIDNGSVLMVKCTHNHMHRAEVSELKIHTRETILEQAENSKKKKFRIINKTQKKFDIEKCQNIKKNKLYGDMFPNEAI